MYIGNLCLRRDAVGRKKQKKWRTNCWFLLQDNAPAHQSVLVKLFLAKDSMTTQEHPPNSSGLAPTDVYLLPGLKSALE
jgi:hypothetical protein